MGYYTEDLMESYTEDLSLPTCPFCGNTAKIISKSDYNSLYDIGCKTKGCYLEYGADWHLPYDKVRELWCNRSKINKEEIL